MRKSSIKLFHILVSLLPYTFVFLASLFPPKDPDLGWHLKYGEYIFQHYQILRENIFSTQMTNYQWPNGSWGTDYITYFIYNYWGFLGLTFASALIVTFTFFFFAKAAKFTILDKAIFFPLLVYLEYAININSFRGEQISLLFLGILFYLLNKYLSNPKKRKILYSIPLLFLVWCNTQEESFLGLGLLGLWIGCIFIKNAYYAYFHSQKSPPNENKSLLFTLISSFLVTFINPYGYGIHLIAISHIYNPLLQTISEYGSFSTKLPFWWNQIFIAVLLVLWLLYLFSNRIVMKSLHLITIPVILLLASFAFRRYSWPLYYLILPYLPIFGKLYLPYIKKHLGFITLTILWISVAIAVKVKLPITKFADYSWYDYCQLVTIPCSFQSADFLQQNRLTKNVFTYYDWGGWLIWNYPDIKPSIDGRMTIWQDKNGFIPRSDFEAYMRGSKDIDASSYDIVYIPANRDYPLYMELANLAQKKKWRLVYNDDFAVVIVRVK